MKPKKLCLEKELTIDSVEKSDYYNIPYKITANITENHFDSYNSTFILRDSDLQKLCGGEKNFISLVGKKLSIILKQKNYRSWKNFSREKDRTYLKVSQVEYIEKGSPKSPYGTIRKVILDSHQHERADFHPVIIKPPSFYLILPLTKGEYANFKSLAEYCSFKLNYKLK